MNKQEFSLLDDAFTLACTRRRFLLRQAHKENDVTAELSLEQGDVIATLNRLGPALTVNDIVAETTTPFANLTRTIHGLEKKGLVYRARGKKDRRQVFVRLTLEGRNTAQVLKKVRKQFFESFWSSLSPAEQNSLKILLSFLNSKT